MLLSCSSVMVIPLQQRCIPERTGLTSVPRHVEKVRPQHGCVTSVFNTVFLQGKQPFIFRIRLSGKRLRIRVLLRLLLVLCPYVLPPFMDTALCGLLVLPRTLPMTSASPSVEAGVATQRSNF